MISRPSRSATLRAYNDIATPAERWLGVGCLGWALRRSGLVHGALATSSAPSELLAARRGRASALRASLLCARLLLLRRWSERPGRRRWTMRAFAFAARSTALARMLCDGVASAAECLLRSALDALPQTATATTVLLQSPIQAAASGRSPSTGNDPANSATRALPWPYHVGMLAPSRWRHASAPLRRDQRRRRRSALSGPIPARAA
jgi:hypothetical protein